ncbi:putative pectate lyase [Actinoplanes missouriensis 431]|uniref:pectate lyase n=1 Tax=Actinoplanes missouriensis (strain ATCC 14538 / DSM 43046 / CBS 188.64 / JCM 3121 / NBRC 102363 / NCIMB 12654 / NRRL B-3342 / UNCC 431) TaxID=512565 RepID=I0HH67_ACTM4|nr:pectate lyase [Actinoplanes missouriensis]BAL92354.1 putative pectate lyase [Actinoplanes missouriensis 431]
MSLVLGPGRRWAAVAVTTLATAALGAAGLVTAQQASAASIDLNAYYVLKNQHSGKVLDVWNYSTADGAVINQWSQNNGDWQQFKFLDMGSGNYRLQAKHSGKVLNVQGASTADGAQIIQSNGDRNATSQQWKIQDIGSNIQLINRNSGKALEVFEWSTADGGNVVQYADQNFANQQWQLIKMGSSGGGGGTGPTTPWPSETGSVKVNATIAVPASGLDGGNKRYYGIGDGGQSESQDPMFKLANGATLANVIIGAPAGDGVHCDGNCTLRNVWWLDVGEDAATFRGGSSTVATVDGGGARSASDKVFQHNGGGTLTIKNFQVSNFGKLYRSCGNCSTQYKRTVVIQNIRATAPGSSIAGINTNYGDTATFSQIVIVGDSSRKISICDRFTGNSSGNEPTKTGSGPDGTYCRYSTSDITYS